MSFRDMVLQRSDFTDNHATHETEPASLVSFLQCQSPLMVGWLAIMGLNLVFLLVTFQ